MRSRDRRRRDAPDVRAIGKRNATVVVAVPGGSVHGLGLVAEVAESIEPVVSDRDVETPEGLIEAGRALGIDDEDLAKAVAYSGGRSRFGRVSGWAEVLVGLAFIALGGLGLVESGARAVADGLGFGALVTGLAFFGIVGVLSGLFALPFDLYDTFVIEERHGFNRQTLRGFVLDRVKGIDIER